LPDGYSVGLSYVYKDISLETVSEFFLKELGIRGWKVESQSMEGKFQQAFSTLRKQMEVAKERGQEIPNVDEKTIQGYLSADEKYVNQQIKKLSPTIIEATSPDGLKCRIIIQKDMQDNTNVNIIIVKPGSTVNLYQF